MFVQYDDEIPPLRKHPWTIVENQPGAQYWSFREQPGLIPEVLEDFKPFAHYAAIQQFYELLAWLNGPDSIFETNDCALGIPKVDSATPVAVRQAFESDPIGIGGRLTFFLRNQHKNASRPLIDWLKRSIHDALRDRVGNFPSVVFVGEWEHLFTSIDTEGHAIIMRFWAWGDDEEHMMTNLKRTFDILLQLFKGISASAKQHAASQQP